jgi:hypothetical protein
VDTWLKPRVNIGVSRFGGSAFGGFCSGSAGRRRRQQLRQVMTTTSSKAAEGQDAL